MKKPFFQALFLWIIYKGFVKWFLRIFVGVYFGDNRSVKEEKQFIIVANHNSHLDTMSLMASLPGKIIWKVKPVAAQDYFGNTKLKKKLSNYFINTLLIQRKRGSEEFSHPIKAMLETLDKGYSLILFPEGTRGNAKEMGDIKPGIGQLLSARPHIKYIPVYMTGMGHSLPKGSKLILPHKSSVHYGKPSLAASTKQDEIMQQVAKDFSAMQELFYTKVEDDD